MWISTVAVDILIGNKKVMLLFHYKTNDANTFLQLGI